MTPATTTEREGDTVHISTEHIDDRTVVCHVGGELDAYTAPDLRDALAKALEEGAAWVVADLRELTYLDSTGLGILVGTAKSCRQAGGDLAVACDRANLLRIFQVSGTQEILNVVAEVEGALDRLRQLGESRPAGADAEEGTQDAHAGG